MSNTISGHVVASTGAGNSDNAQVTLTGVRTNGPFKSQTIPAASDGTYSFGGLAPGTYQISASTHPIATGPHAGWVYRYTKVVKIDAANPQDQLNINLIPVAPTTPK